MSEEFTFWLDAHLSPNTAKFIESRFSFRAQPIRNLGGRDLSDIQIFMKLREPGNVLITKDSDFAELILRHGAPPQIIWLTFGNSSNAHLAEVLEKDFPSILELLRFGERLIEIS